MIIAMIHGNDNGDFLLRGEWYGHALHGKSAYGDVNESSFSCLLINGAFNRMSMELESKPLTFGVVCQVFFGLLGRVNVNRGVALKFIGKAKELFGDQPCRIMFPGCLLTR